MSEITILERIMKVETQLANHEIVLNKTIDKLESLQKTIWLASGALMFGSFILRLVAEYFSHK